MDFSSRSHRRPQNEQNGAKVRGSEQEARNRSMRAPADPDEQHFAPGNGVGLARNFLATENALPELLGAPIDSTDIALRVIPNGDSRTGLVRSITADIILIECRIDTTVGDCLALGAGLFAYACVLWVGDGLLLCKLESWGDPPDTAAPDSGISSDDGNVISKEMAAFGKRLQRLRYGRGLKQSDVAERLGVSTAAVSQWEKGRKLPRGTRWLDLCDCLGVNINDLTGHPNPDLRLLISESRAQIARAAGIGPQRVRISLEM